MKFPFRVPHRLVAAAPFSILAACGGLAEGGPDATGKDGASEASEASPDGPMDSTTPTEAGSDAPTDGRGGGQSEGASDAGKGDATIEDGGALPCAQVLAGDPSGVFYGACLTTASAGDATQAFYMVVNMTVAPGAGGSPDQVSAILTYLDLHPTNVSQTVGPTSSPPTANISSTCTFSLDAGTVTVPAAANATGNDLTLTGTTYGWELLTPAASCADLSATLTMPVSIDLTQGGNYCVFRRAPADGTITPFKLSDFACPGSPG